MSETVAEILIDIREEIIRIRKILEKAAGPQLND